MKRPLAGKKAFYAMGQRDRSLGNKTPKYIHGMPDWVIKAYKNGWNGW